MNDATEVLWFDVTNPAHRAAFVARNRAWLERYFEIEPHDLEQLNDPETHVLNGGGRIFLAADDAGAIIGTLALIATAPGEFEMTKRAVAEHQQGRGVGRKLCVAALEWARSVGANLAGIQSPPDVRPNSL